MTKANEMTAALLRPFEKIPGVEYPPLMTATLSGPGRRRRVAPEDLRCRGVHVALTDSEYRKVIAAAKASDVRPTIFARAAILMQATRSDALARLRKGAA